MSETTITPLVQKVSTTLMKNSGPGIEVKLLFPLAGHSALALMLMEQQGNPIHVSFSDPIQARLPAAPRDTAEADIEEPEDEAEEVEMIVNGEEAKVRRPRSSRNGNSASSGYTLHAFEENPETPGLCKHCHKRPEDGTVHGDLEPEAPNLEPGEGDVLPATAQRLIDDANEDLAALNAAAAAESEAAAAAQVAALAEGK